MVKDVIIVNSNSLDACDVVHGRAKTVAFQFIADLNFVPLAAWLIPEDDFRVTTRASCEPDRVHSNNRVCVASNFSGLRCISTILDTDHSTYGPNPLGNIAVTSILVEVENAAFANRSTNA